MNYPFFAVVRLTRSYNTNAVEAEVLAECKDRLDADGIFRVRSGLCFDHRAAVYSQLALVEQINTGLTVRIAEAKPRSGTVEVGSYLTEFLTKQH